MSGHKINSKQKTFIFGKIIKASFLMFHLLSFKKCQMTEKLKPGVYIKQVNTLIKMQKSTLKCFFL